MKDFILQAINEFEQFKELEELTSEEAIKVVSEKYNELPLAEKAKNLEQHIMNKGVLEAVKNLLTEEQFKDIMSFISQDSILWRLSDFVLTLKPQGAREDEYEAGYIDHRFYRNTTTDLAIENSGIIATPLINGLYLQYSYASYKKGK